MDIPNVYGRVNSSDIHYHVLATCIIYEDVNVSTKQ